MSVSYQQKQCWRCGEIQRESSFRYIKFFDKRRTICKRCEARERHKRRRLVEQHVEEHGVTPGVYRRIKTQATLEARNQATQTVLGNLPPTRVRSYRWARTIIRIGDIAMGLCIPIGVFALTQEQFRWVLMVFIIGVSVAAGRQLLNHRYAQPVDLEISQYIRSIYPLLFKGRLQERIEYERFYSSPEWRVIRRVFLRTQKKIDGYYLCEYCQGSVWQTDVTVDHFQPRSKFPDLAMDIANLRVAHRRCNSSKGDTIIGEE